MIKTLKTRCVCVCVCSMGFREKQENSRRLMTSNWYNKEMKQKPKKNWNFRIKFSVVVIPLLLPGVPAGLLFLFWLDVFVVATPFTEEERKGSEEEEETTQHVLLVFLLEAASNITTVSWSVLIIYYFFFSLFDFIVIWISRYWFDETRPRDKKRKRRRKIEDSGRCSFTRERKD